MTRASIVAGERFAALVTVRECGRANDGHKIWLCQCDCGNECTKPTNMLRQKRRHSCGCLIGEAHQTHGMRYSREYESWASAKERCHNPQSKDFHRYGAKNVSVCEQWRQSFPAFLAHMGPRPANTTLDRYPNPNGNYEPGNCRWATAREQARNKRCSVWLQWKGKKTHLSDIAAEMGISYSAAYMRFKRGKLHAIH